MTRPKINDRVVLNPEAERCKLLLSLPTLSNLRVSSIADKGASQTLTRAEFLKSSLYTDLFCCNMQ